MTTVRDPRIKPVSIADLRPTQITVGMREVDEKRRHWREKKTAKGAEFLGEHMIPVILGPKQRHYVTDHHHLCRALHEEGVEFILTNVVADLSDVEPDSFWFFLDNRSWIYPFDEKGKRRPYDAIPKSVDKLVDDPYRSIAGELRRLGGYAKDTVPFSEFLWADFLRRRIKRKLIDADFTAATGEALRLAKSVDANYLPGWCGPVSD
ncbi:ParB-like protein [Rhodoblastus sp.]|uniref:ParB-like protein n=1 Tax=Rhodoblastus sp. TaxID=1962975 RepID=UPI003F9DB31B